MTPRHIQLVQCTWTRIVAPIRTRAAGLFYNRLFQIDPQLRPMFKEDLAEQRRKLMEMLHVAVNGLLCLEVLVPEIEELGRRHLVQHGVAEEHYDTVGTALAWMLEENLVTPSPRKSRKPGRRPTIRWPK